MSFDFNFRVSCDHKVKKERLKFERDSQTILLPRAIGSSRDFSFYLEGVKQSPSSFSIEVKHEEGDTVSEGSDVLFFEAGKEYVLRELDIDIESLIFRNFLSLEVSYVSAIFDIFLDEDSRTHLICSEEAKVLNNSLIHIKYSFKPIFVESLKYNQYLLRCTHMYDKGEIPEVSYTTTVDNCRKCNAIGVINDFSIDSVGNLEFVEDTSKLLQDAYIFTFTVKGSDPEYPELGTKLLELVGSRYSEASTKGMIRVDVSESLKLLQKLQDSQSKVQTLSAAEYLNSFKGVDVVRDDYDFSKFYIKLRISSLSDSDLEVNSVSSYNRIA